jgi:chitodextrinase
MFRRISIWAATLTAAVGVATAPGGTAHAAGEPLPTPATPVATAVTTTSVTVSWAAVAGPVAGYTVHKASVSGLFSPLATTTATSYTVTGLTPDTVVMFRVVANAAGGSGLADSRPSGTLYVTTRPLPESVPPTAPGTPFTNFVGTTHVTLHFSPSTDNMRVAGYVAQREIDGVWTDVATNNITTVYVQNLTPDTTYTFAVVAFDPNGNRSPRSAPFTVTTRAITPYPTCRAQLNSFGQSYLVSITIENMTVSPLENWSVTFHLPTDHTVQYVVMSTLTRAGAQGTLRPTASSARISAGYRTSLSIFGSYPAGSVLPSGFVLNGTIACA